MLIESHNPRATFCHCHDCREKRRLLAEAKAEVARSKTNPPFRICHTSDGHGKFAKLPAAEMYIITGDVLPDYLSESKPERLAGGAILVRKEVDRRKAVYYQNKLVKALEGKGREALLTSPDSPVVLVRGNHDRVSLASIFGGDNTYEIGTSATVFPDICGFKVGGVRGIKYVHGEWEDELRNEVFSSLVSDLPDDLDILVTHAPPLGVLDSRKSYGGRDGNHGAPSLGKFHASSDNPNTKLRLHCFGHVHGGFGMRSTGEPPKGQGVGLITASNAAGGTICYTWNGTRMVTVDMSRNLNKNNDNCRKLSTL